MKGSEFSSRLLDRRSRSRRPSHRWAQPALRRTLLTLAALVLSTLACPALTPERRTEPAGEYQVKALFLYNFAKFVDWPPSNFASPQDSFTLCVVGEDPFGGELDRAVVDKTIKGRRVSVKRISNAQDARACQIAFIGSTNEKRVKKLLEELSFASVLTVGDGSGFTDWGGIVKFTLDDNKIRFEINIDAAERARLKISSQLLSLAKTVIRKGRS
jgi:hypothetical protein